MDRRKFLEKTGIITAGAVLSGTVFSGCANPEQKSDKQTPVLHHKGLKDLQGSGVQFIDAAGNSVDFGQLEKDLGKNNSTLSFMFGGCGPTCPRSITVLNTLSQKDPNLKHVIVSASPINDFSDTSPYSGMLRIMLNQYGVNYENSIILFPTLTGKKEDLVLQPDIDAQRKALNAKVKTAQEAINLLPLNNSGADINHSGKIKLYDPQGKFLQESLEPNADKMAAQLLEKLVPVPTKGGEMQR